MKYHINMVNSGSPDEKQAGAGTGMRLNFTVLCFVLLGLSTVYTIYQIVDMKAALIAERKELGRIMAEHKNYPTPEKVVKPADIELLEKLRSERIIWSKITEALSSHLPSQYSITKFNYKRNKLKVAGTGYAEYNQNPLTQLHKYLTALQKDPDYREVFNATRLKSFTLSEKNKNRFFFEFYALSKH